MSRIASSILILLYFTATVSASTGGTALPWEGPLQAIADSLTGPVAYVISVVGIVVAGAMLVWGGEINEFARRLIMLVVAVDHHLCRKINRQKGKKIDKGIDRKKVRLLDLQHSKS